MAASFQLTLKTIALIVVICMVAGAIGLFFLFFSTPDKNNGVTRGILDDAMNAEPEVAPVLPGFSSEDKIIDPSIMDTSVRPEKDLYHYANGEWLDTYTVPPVLMGYTWRKTEGEITTNVQLLALVSDIGKRKSDGENLTQNEEKLYAFYLSGINTEKNQKNDDAEVQVLLDSIEDIETRQDVQKVSIDLMKKGINPFFGFTTYLNAKNPQTYTGWISVTGSGIPQEYFTGTAGGSEDFKDRYKEYIKNCLKRAGYWGENLEVKTRAVYEIDERLRSFSGGPGKIYSLSDLDRECSGSTPGTQFRWSEFPKQAAGSDFSELWVYNGEIDAFCSVYTTRSPDDLKAYLAFSVVDRLLPYLKDSDYDIWSGFYSPLWGEKQQKPRNYTVIMHMTEVLPDLAAEEYTRHYLTPDSTAGVEKISSNIRAAYLARIANNSWISESGRSAANKKIQNMKIILVPQKFSSSTDLEITSDSVIKNFLNSGYHNYLFSGTGIARINREKESGILFPDYFVNSYYRTYYNEVDILPYSQQKPLFFPEQDLAVQYAVLGRLVGHEMGHGLDNEGISLNENGMTGKILVGNDLEEFNDRKEKLLEQFDSCRLNNEIDVDKNKSAREILADLSGLNAAYDAYHTTEPASFMIKDTTGFTGEQRFFIAYAQSMREKYTDEGWRYNYFDGYFLTHPPNECRVNMIVRNMADFYRAFGVDPEQNGVTEIVIW